MMDDKQVFPLDCEQERTISKALTIGYFCALIASLDKNAGENPSEKAKHAFRCSVFTLGIVGAVLWKHGMNGPDKMFSPQVLDSDADAREAHHLMCKANEFYLGSSVGEPLVQGLMTNVKDFFYLMSALVGQDDSADNVSGVLVSLAKMMHDLNKKGAKA